MDILRQAGYRIIVAHFNHKLRENSDLEANAVEQMAARLGLPSVIESGDVRAFADEKKLSIEDAARTLRYRFLFTQAREHQRRPWRSVTPRTIKWRPCSCTSCAARG